MSFYGEPFTEDPVTEKTFRGSFLIRLAPPTPFSRFSTYYTFFPRFPFFSFLPIVLDLERQPRKELLKPPPGENHFFFFQFALLSIFYNFYSRGDGIWPFLTNQSISDFEPAWPPVKGPGGNPTRTADKNHPFFISSPPTLSRAVNTHYLHLSSRTFFSLWNGVRFRECPRSLALVSVTRRCRSPFSRSPYFVFAFPFSPPANDFLRLFFTLGTGSFPYPVLVSLPFLVFAIGSRRTGVDR